jgi:hypothetical protein
MNKPSMVGLGSLTLSLSATPRARQRRALPGMQTRTVSVPRLPSGSASVATPSRRSADGRRACDGGNSAADRMPCTSLLGRSSPAPLLRQNFSPAMRRLYAFEHSRCCVSQWSRRAISGRSTLSRAASLRT